MYYWTERFNGLIEESICFSWKDTAQYAGVYLLGLTKKFSTMTIQSLSTLQRVQQQEGLVKITCPLHAQHTQTHTEVTKLISSSIVHQYRFEILVLLLIIWIWIEGWGPSLISRKLHRQKTENSLFFWLLQTHGSLQCSDTTN